MTIGEFAAVTRGVIEHDGFEDFSPTVCFPQRRDVRVLVGSPSGASGEGVALDWARSLAQPGEEFLIAVKVDPSSFKVIRCVGDVREEGVFLRP